MTTEADKLSYAKSYLRRTKTLAELKALADQVFRTATDPVTITGTGFEGGHGSGVVTFERALLGLAIEELIAELDPAVAASTLPDDRYLNFGGQPVRT